MKKDEFGLNWFVKYIGPIMIVLSLVFILIIAERLEGVFNSNFDSKTNTFEENWVLQVEGKEDEKITFPFSIKDGTRKCILKNTLNTEITDKDNLILKYQYQSVDVYVDGVKIYEFSEPRIRNMSTILGTNVLSIPLKEEYEGKTIELHMEGIKPIEPVSISHIYITTVGDYLHKVFKENIAQLLIAGLMFITGFIYLIVYITSKLKKLKLSVPNEYFLSLFLFSISISVWIVSDLHLLFLTTGHIVVNDIMSYYSFMCIPIGFVAIIQYLLKKYNIAFIVMEAVFSLNLLTQTLLFASGAVDLANMLIVSQALMFTGLITIIVLVIIAAVKEMNRDRLALLIGFGIFGVFIGVCIIGYIFGTTDFNYNIYFLLGMLSISLLFGYYILKELVIVMGENASLEMTRKYAYTDALTSLGNRRAFEEMITEEKNKNNENFAIIGFDINYLKRANDTLGHNAGDELIIATANLLKETFDNTDTKLFRTGGDEFSAISHLPKTEVEKLLDLFKNKVDAWYGELNKNLSVSYGFACKIEHPEASLDELKIKADEKMYEDKKNYHKTEK